jgi:hypothetical protein
MLSRKPYPSDVSDEEGALVAPYLTLLPEGAGQREHPCGRYSTGCGTWSATAQPGERCLRTSHPGTQPVIRPSAGFGQAAEMLVQDLRAVLRLAQGRPDEPSAAVLDSRTLRSP